MNIGTRIKERRKELKMSAEELGKKLGKDRSTIYRYEKGDIENLPLDILEPIANALQTTPQYLMGWNTEQKKKNGTEPETMTIGNLFEYLRKQRNLSVSEFAEEIGLTEAEIKKYETGSGGIPVEIAKMLADYFNISSENLTTRQVKMKDIVAAFASTNEAYVQQMSKWVEIFGNEKFSDDEFGKLIEYGKFLIYLRGNKA